MSRLCLSLSLEQIESLDPCGRELEKLRALLQQRANKPDDWREIKEPLSLKVVPADAGWSFAAWWIGACIGFHDHHCAPFIKACLAYLLDGLISSYRFQVTEAQKKSILKEANRGLWSEDAAMALCQQVSMLCYLLGEQVNDTTLGTRDFNSRRDQRINRLLVEFARKYSATSSGYPVYSPRKKAKK